MISQTAEPGVQASPSAIDLTKFAALAGRWRFQGRTATYLGGEEKPGRARFGIALSAARFRSGRVSVGVSLSRTERTTAGVMFGYQSLQAPYLVAQIGAYSRAYALSEFRSGEGWTGIADAGNLSNLEAGKVYRLVVQVTGQRVQISVDDVLVIDVVLRRPIGGTGLGLFAWDDAEITFSDGELIAVPPRVFVIMPFSEPFDSLYREVIAPVSKDMGFTLVRVDEINGPGIILDDIQQQIAQADAVVAEISTPNPNVFYELGYAHALEKPAVLLVRREQGSQMPFDIRGYRAIFYDDSIAGKRLVEDKLREHLRAVAREP